MQGKWEFKDSVIKGGSEKLYFFPWKLKWGAEQTEMVQIGYHR